MPPTSPNVAYGIDRDGDRVVIVRSSRKRKATDTVVLNESIGADSGIHPHIASLAADVAEGGAATASALPATAGVARWLVTPFPSRAKATRVLPSLLDLQLPFPLEQCEYAFPRLEPGADGNIQALAIAARRGELNAHVDSLTPLGIDPMHIEHEGPVLWDCARPSSASTRAVMYLGRERCTLVLGENDSLRSTHGFRFGAGTLSHDDPALAQWIARIQHILRSQTTTDDPVGWTWVGPGAEDAAFVQRLEAALPDRLQFELPDAPATALPAALARRALRATEADANLRRGEMEHPLARSRRDQQVTRLSIAGIAAGFLLFAVAQASIFVFEARNRALQEGITDLAVELTELPVATIKGARGNELFIVQQHRAESADSSDPFRLAVRGGPGPILGPLVQQAATLGIRIGSFTADGNTFTLRGTAADEASCRTCAEALAEFGIQATVEPGAPTPDGRIPFLLKGSTDDA